VHLWSFVLSLEMLPGSKRTAAMLVLSRRTDGMVLMPTLGITIRVLKVHRGRVSLGISAPDRVRITRGKPHRLPESSERAGGGPEFLQ
jgi:carbon storage regulator CsrA